MSATRHAKPDVPLIDRQERYMSAPEFQELRGISGSAVAAKVCYLVHDPRKRELLLFLQGLSLEPGGMLENVIKPLLQSHASHLGSPTMHRLGINARPYKRDSAADIDYELCNRRTQANRLLNGFYGERDDEERKLVETSPQALVEKCRQLALDHMESFLIELCINPYVPLLAAGQVPTGTRDELDYYDSKTGQLTYFKDIHGALFEFQQTHNERIAKQFVKTEVATIVFDVLNKAGRRNKIFVIEGREGVGKSESAKAFCAMYPGRARFVDLKGMSSHKEVFRAINKALGLSATYTRKQGDLKSRAEDFLRQTGVLLVIDEATQLLPAGERIRVQPEMLNWVYTLTNSGSSIVLITTSLFFARVQKMAQQIAWNMGQVERRVVYRQLPDKPAQSDLEAVARRLLAGASAATIKLLVGYAGSARHPLTVMADVVGEAKDFATAARHESVTVADVEAAISELTPTYEARSEAFHRSDTRPRSGRRATPLKGDFKAPERRVPITLEDEDLPEAMESSRSRFAGQLQAT
jgi:hypothetical protein